MTENRSESELTRYLRMTQPIHYIEQVDGGYQAHYLPPYVPEPTVFPAHIDERAAILDIPDLYASISMEKELFDAEVARRHNPAVIYQRARPAIDAYQREHPFVEDEEPLEEV